MGATGLEPPANPSGNSHVPDPRGSKSGNIQVGSAAPSDAPTLPATPPTMPADPDLAAVARAWPGLPPAVRAGIVAMVKASAGR